MAYFYKITNLNFVKMTTYQYMHTCMSYFIIHTINIGTYHLSVCRLTFSPSSPLPATCRLIQHTIIYRLHWNHRFPTGFGALTTKPDQIMTSDPDLTTFVFTQEHRYVMQATCREQKRCQNHSPVDKKFKAWD